MSEQTGTAGGPLDSLGVSVMGDHRYSALMIVQADLHNPRLACVDLLGILQFTNEIPSILD